MEKDEAIMKEERVRVKKHKKKKNRQKTKP